MTIAGDLTDPAFCTEVVEQAAAELAGLDILVNNAGKQIVSESLEDLPDEQVEQTYQANILAMFRTTRAALKHLPRGSTIINTTSVQAYQPAPILLDYASGQDKPAIDPSGGRSRAARRDAVSTGVTGESETTEGWQSDE